MELRQLKALQAVGEHRSFSKAAKALHTVQSNVSTHVSKLERELSTELFDRFLGQLTPEGQTVVAAARRIDAEIEAMQAEIAASKGSVAGRVRLGVITTTARWLMRSVLEEMVSFPGISMSVVEATTTGLHSLLRDGNLDVAIVNLPIPDPAIETTPLFEENLLLVAAGDHPLRHRDTCWLRDLHEETLLLPPRGTALRDEIETAAASAKIRLKAKAELDGVRLLSAMVNDGLGAAILPATAIQAWRPGGWFSVRIEDLPPRVVGAATRRNFSLTPAARTLIQVVTDSLRTGVAGQPELRLL